MKSVRVIVSGRVQGVWFRGWTVEQATDLGLVGSVRNCRNGTVEAVLCGPDDRVDRMLNVLWQGPPLADVTEVEAKPCEEPTDRRFRQLPSA
mgnify:CR=1 FL=1